MEELLNKVFEAYLRATGKDPTDDSIRIGVESDFLCHKAKDYLKLDNTGLLSALTMIEAYKSFIKEHSCTIEELLNGEWDSLKPKFKVLEDLLYKGTIGEVYNNFINLIIKHASVLGKNYTKESILSIKKIENIITKAIEKFNDKYYFKHERFNEGNLKINKDAKILPKLYRFEYLKAFVDKMKQADEDNFICIALIDRTYETIEDEYYDNNLDSFFAFGFKNNGVVYTISDRVTFDSPEGAFKSRNPGRAMRDKIDYDWLPYYKLDKIKEGSSNQLLLTFNNDSIGYNITDLFDNEGIIYTTLIMTLIYNKYFCQECDNIYKRQYFSSEIKLLPINTSKALALNNQLQLPIPSNNIKAETYCYEGKSYSNSIYDYLIDQYPLETTLPTLKNFIGDKETAEKYIWWNVRKQQADHIKKCLSDSYYENEYNLKQWQRTKVVDNLKDIINFMIDNPDKDCFTTNYNASHRLEEADRKYFWQAFRDNDKLETYKLTTCLNEDNFNHSGYQKIIGTKYGDIKYSCYGDHNYITFVDDNNRKYCSIELILRSHSDLERFFNINNEDLPKEFRKHFYSRSSAYSLHAWMPYTGNSILEFTDPMNDIRDPFNEIGCTIYLFVSKSKLKQLKRIISEKS